MRPFDRAILPLLSGARYELCGAVTATVAGGLLIVAQAFVVAELVVSVVETQRVGSWAAVAILLFAARAVVAWIGDVETARAAARLGVSLRRRVLERAVGARLGTPGKSPGTLVALATRGVSAIEPYLTRFLPALVVATTLPLLVVLAIATQDWVSAVIVVVTLPLVPVFAALVGWATRTKAQRQWRQMATLAGHFHDVVRGLPTLVAFRRANAQTRTIWRITDRYRRATLETLRLAFASSAVLELVATISVALVAVSVGLRLADGQLDLRAGLIVLLLAPEAYWPLRRVGAEFHAAAEGGATLHEISNLDGDPVTQRSGLYPPDLRTAAITLTEVSVTYPGRTAPALGRVSAVVQPRQLVAIAGPSGVGKSTLLAAIRSQVERRGSIDVGDVSLDTLDPETWSDQIAWVSQRPWFVDGSIADNVRLARPDATDAEVWNALHRVGLTEVTLAKTLGLDAQVGEDGKNLSAGERARLSLARVVVARRPLTLLDEPTAHLDAETEHVVLDTLRWLSGVSTVLVVAHRQAVLDIADQVITLKADTDAIQSLAAGGAPHLVAREEPERPQPRTAAAAADANALAEESELNRHRTAQRLWLGIVAGTLAACCGVALTATAGWLIVRASERPAVLTLLVAIIAVRTFGIGRPVLRYVERLLSHDAALRALADERVAVYSTLIPLTPGALGRRRGDLLASVVDDVDAQVDRRLRVWSPVATAFGVGIVATLAAGLVLPAAGMVVAGISMVGLGSFALAWVLAARAERAFVQDRAILSRDVTAFVEGREHIAAWGATAGGLDAITKVGARMGRTAVRSALGASVARAILTLCVGIGVATTAAITVGALRDGTVSGPVAALLIFIPLGLSEVLNALPDAGTALARVNQAVDRLRGLGRMAPLVSDPDEAKELGQLAHLDLSHVSGGWNGSAVFDSVDVELLPGQRLAVVGPSGSGKSTLAALILRFVDPIEGSISLGGVDLREAWLDSVRMRVGLVDDDPHVFGSTVAENIRLARPSASDADVEAALVAAHLGDWLRTLPGGLDTFVGDGGDEVSGGERARLALARSLLADQAVLVLDEPVSHLDSATARLVLDDLLASSEGRTVVLITHGADALTGVDYVIDLGADSQSSSEDEVVRVS